MLGKHGKAQQKDNLDDRANMRDQLDKQQIDNRSIDRSIDLLQETYDSLDEDCKDKIWGIIHQSYQQKFTHPIEDSSVKSRELSIISSAKENNTYRDENSDEIEKRKCTVLFSSQRGDTVSLPSSKGREVIFVDDRSEELSQTVDSRLKTRYEKTRERVKDECSISSTGILKTTSVTSHVAPKLLLRGLIGSSMVPIVENKCKDSSSVGPYGDDDCNVTETSGKVKFEESYVNDVFRKYDTASNLHAYSKDMKSKLIEDENSREALVSGPMIMTRRSAAPMKVQKDGMPLSLKKFRSKDLTSPFSMVGSPPRMAVYCSRNGNDSMLNINNI